MRAINSRARLIVERHNRRKLDELIRKLKTRTVERGCTPAEAAAARTAVERMQKVAKDWNRAALAPDELRRVRAWLKNDR
jgi:hypothetical protein